MTPNEIEKELELEPTEEAESGDQPPRLRSVPRAREPDEGDDDDDDEPHVETEEGEPWLISYADLMTLLFGLFAMLLSMSKFENEEYETVRRAISRYFGNQALSPSTVEKLKDRLKIEFSKSAMLADTGVEETKTGLELTLRTTYLFGSGQATLLPQAVAPIEAMIDVITEKKSDLYIRISGHTDDNPILKGNVKYPSNWELSGARGATLVRMFQAHGYPPEKLTFIGYGDTRPLLPNRDKAGNPIVDNQALNRRVVVELVMPRPPAPASAPLPALPAPGGEPLTPAEPPVPIDAGAPPAGTVEAPSAAAAPVAAPASAPAPAAPVSATASAAAPIPPGGH